MKEKGKALKAKDTECKILRKEKTENEKVFEKSLLELGVSQNEKMVENNNKVNFRCTLCDEKCESKVNLSQHVRKIHHKDQVSQTQANPVKIETELNSEYPCFYCGQRICSSEEKLEKHYGECREYGLVYHENNNKSSQPSPFLHQFSDLKYFYPPPFTLPADAPCYTCSERFENKIEL